MEGSPFKPFRLLFFLAVGAGAWYFFTHFRIQGLENLRVESRSGQSAAPGAGDPAAPPPNPLGKTTIRIASVNCGPLDEQKLARPLVAGRIAQLLREYDLVALQDVEARDKALMIRLVELLNEQGRRFDFATAPHVGRDPVQQYSAFLYDAETIEIDRSTVALVRDPTGTFRHPPLVASFRARGPADREAFTFTLINLHTPADRMRAELPLLAPVYRAVRDNGRNEDDIVLLGELGIDDAHLADLVHLPNLTCVLSGLMTTTRGNRMADNLLLDRRATCEFTHRAGVADLARELGCSPQEAAEVSEHLPVWAEFSVYEGGQAGAAGPQ